MLGKAWPCVLVTGTSVLLLKAAFNLAGKQLPNLSTAYPTWQCKFIKRVAKREPEIAREMVKYALKLTQAIARVVGIVTPSRTIVFTLCAERDHGN